MAKKILTAVAVAQLRPGKERRDILDGGCRGLFLTIYPSGRKSWTMRVRRGDKHAKLTLGPADVSGRESSSNPVVGDPLTLAAARKLAIDIQHQRALGKDVIVDCAAMKRQRRRDARLPVNLATIPDKWLAFADRGIEPTCFLYRHYDADGGLLYVGMSLHVYTRQSRHLKKAEWASRIYQIIIEPFTTREELIEAEILAIRTEYPKYNIAHNGRRHEMPWRVDAVSDLMSSGSHGRAQEAGEPESTMKMTTQREGPSTRCDR